MSEMKRLNTMTEDELREFAKFAYTSYPTLLVTHEKRKAFHKKYPDKDPNRFAKGENQMDLFHTKELD